MTDLLRTPCCAHAHYRDDCDNCAEITRLTREIADWRASEATHAGPHPARLASIVSDEELRATRQDNARLTDDADMWRRMATKLADDADGLTREVARLTAVVAQLRGALERAIQQLEGCAREHYARDYVEQGPPAWLDELRAAVTSDGSPLLAVVEAARVLIEYPPDCDACAEQREQALHVYGIDASVNAGLCSPHLVEYNRCYDVWAAGIAKLTPGEQGA